MASPPRKPLSLVFCMVLLSFFFFSCSVLASRTFPSDTDKVELGLYYESLCPYSANFIINYLVKVFEDDDLLSVVDLHLYPWGNAKIRNGTKTTFDCQHGPSECLLNTVEACAIAIWPDVNEHFQFIYCVETLVYEHKYPEWETCFEKLGLDPKAISDCYTSGNGTELELHYAAETNSLEPPHQYVPWVVVDGQPLYEDYENFISYICKAYNGTALPKACSNITLNTVYKEKAEPTGPVCNKETTTCSTQIRSAITSWMRKMNMAVSM
ncbi:gamma-interferon-responsive lysosomal thiol protein isoform X2 [Pistacia vera]|uniref:gamma-interferon-responsive lysosomal thiol protein isoform X2 n=1 Tax=Pistacia vera TaxID=55513 RepID=UPI001262E0EF|nr:gamma-interferon-responsive lysosomal thiol protein isoform X2 [Pistacia vera]